MSDLINRQATLDTLNGIKITKGANWYEFYQKALTAVGELPTAQLAQDLPKGCTDTISRSAAIKALNTEIIKRRLLDDVNDGMLDEFDTESILRRLPSAQPNLSEAYSKAVFTWLMDYQIRAAELKGRYAPYEVLSWVINDWRKEHERSD